MTSLIERLRLRRLAIESIVICNSKITTKDVAIALGVKPNTILRDVETMDNIWQQDNYLYYGKRL